jgi:hypothetical protein
MIELPSNKELPASFEYPKEFLWLLEKGISDLTPWLILERKFILSRYDSLRERYPSRNLFPFAYRQDCDELACWDVNDGGKIKVIEDYARANPSEDIEYVTFLDWFRQAIEDMIDFCKREVEL